MCADLGVLAPVSAGESRPTLKFAGAAPATVAIEEAFKMALDNLIDINSIPYDPGCSKAKSRTWPGCSAAAATSARSITTSLANIAAASR